MPVCRLCEKTVDKLINSHLIPKAAYKHVRSPNPLVKPSPIKIDQTQKKYYSTDMQVTADFLCKFCEDLFSKNGEKIIGQLWATHKQFPLIDKLTENSKIVQLNGVWTHNDSFLSKEERDGIIYFCISILWRANTWPVKIGGYKNALGEKYELIFREYLLYKTPLNNISFFVFMNSDGVNSGFFHYHKDIRTIV